MKKNIYIAPALLIVQAEPQFVLAMSIDTVKLDWEDDVDLEVKENKVGDSLWDDAW